MKNQPKYGPLIVYIIFTYLLMGVAVPKFFHKMITDNTRIDQYVNEGYKVDYKITNVVYIGKTQIVYAVYYYKGRIIEGEAIPNREVHVGDTYTGYVLSSNIYKVLSPVNIETVKRHLRNLRTYVRIINIIYILIAMILISSMLKEHRFRKRGFITSARLVSVRNVGNSLCGTFEFISFSGLKHRKELLIKYCYAEVGENYDIRYYEKKNGDCVADLIDCRLL